MNTLLENPIGVGIFGLAIVGILVFVAIKLGERKAIYAAAVGLAATAVMVSVSVAIRTDRELIVASLDELAAALRANDHELALSYMHPNATPAIQRARQDLANVKFHEAKVTSVRSTSVNEASRPPTASIEFIGVIKASSERYTGGLPAGGPRLFKIYWMKKNDRWLIRDYEHSDARTALMN